VRADAYFAPSASVSSSMSDVNGSVAANEGHLECHTLGDAISCDSVSLQLRPVEVIDDHSRLQQRFAARLDDSYLRGARLRRVVLPCGRRRPV
jgi:hypothetical protein